MVQRLSHVQLPSDRRSLLERWARQNSNELYLDHDSVEVAGEIEKLRWRFKEDDSHSKGEQMIQIAEALNERNQEFRRVAVGECFEALQSFQNGGLHLRKSRGAYEAQGPRAIQLSCFFVRVSFALDRESFLVVSTSSFPSSLSSIPSPARRRLDTWRCFIAFLF